MKIDDPRLIGQLLQTRMVASLVVATALFIMAYLVGDIMLPAFRTITAALSAAQELAP